MLGLSVDTNHIAWSLSTTCCVYQSYCLASQHYWLCIPIILLGLSVLLVLYTNHIAWSLSTTACVYQSYCWSLSSTGCVYQSYCEVSQGIPIILLGLSVLLVVYTNHIAWSLSTTKQYDWYTLGDLAI